MARMTVATSHQLDCLFPEGLAQCLNGDAYFRVFECNNSLHGVDAILSKRHVNVLIVRANGSNQLEKVRKILRFHPELKVVIVGNNSREAIFEYIKAGVKGYLDDDISPELLKRAIKALHAGEVWFDREISSKLVALFTEQHSTDQNYEKESLLTKREMEILDCVSRCMKNQEISDTLHISESTVKSHLQNIYAKLGVKDRMSATQEMKKWDG